MSHGGGEYPLRPLPSNTPLYSLKKRNGWDLQWMKTLYTKGLFLCGKNQISRNKL
jgi:hypothetical protein